MLSLLSTQSGQDRKQKITGEYNYRIAIDSSCRQLKRSKNSSHVVLGTLVPSALLLSTSCSDSVHQLSVCIYQFYELAR